MANLQKYVLMAIRIQAHEERKSNTAKVSMSKSMENSLPLDSMCLRWRHKVERGIGVVESRRYFRYLDGVVGSMSSVVLLAS